MLFSLATSTLLLPLASALLAPTPPPLFKRGHGNNFHHKRQGLSLLSSGVVPASDVSQMMASMLASQSATAAEAGASSEVSSGGVSSVIGESSGVGAAGGSVGALSESALATSAGEASVTSDASRVEATATAKGELSAGGGASMSMSSMEATATGSAVEASATGVATASAPPPPPASSEVNIDVTVFNLALTLEKLESSFYQQALKKFDVSSMIQAGVTEIQATIIIEQIQVIVIDESSHVSAITGALKAAGATPFDGCSFDFDSALSDPLTFVSVARTLEAVGVSAYLGAAHLITNSILLTAAASIVTLEARHQTLLNVFNGASAVSQPFDIPLAPQQVLALAGGFLQGCQASDLGLVSNQPLSITGDGGATFFSIGTKLEFSSTITIDLQAFSCQMILGGAPVAQVYPAHSCYVPKGVNGPVAVYLTNNTTPLQSNIIDQAAGAIQAGPGLIFVDSKTTALGSLFSEKGWGHLSADMGALYASKLKGDGRVIEIVKQRTITDTETVIIADHGGKGGKSGSQHSPSRMVKVKRGSAGVGGAKVLGWE